MPWLWLIAGPNGSGKSTLARGLIAKGFPAIVDKTGPPSTVWINPDDVFAELAADPAASRDKPEDEIALAAARIADERVLTSIDDGISVVRETVLSTDRFKPIVDMAISRGFQFGLIFVSLASPEECVQRIELRTTLGGHGVPPERTRARWARSIGNLPWFADRAEIVLVYDNSALASPVLLYEKKDGIWTTHKVRLIPEIDAALAPILTVRRRGP